jgi:NAD(P)-dependent dehydrogenase (short-subunit alcohol dehydrogenase family)
MKGKTVLITGATSGIGRSTARELARLGATLFMTCRDRKRGEEAIAEIGDATGNRDLHLLVGDLASQADIRRVATEFLTTGRPLHVLLNNAGVVNLNHELTGDGIETVFAVNHLAYFLLTLLLLDRLKESAPARIVNVASDAHKFGKLDFDDLGGERRYRWTQSYGQSKLANILFTRELARRLEGTGVTVNCLHPGAVATGLGKNNGAWAQRLIGFLGVFFRTPDRGAETSIFLANSPNVEGVSGKYFSNCKERRPSAAASNDEDARRLWKVSAEMTGIGASAVS